MKYICRYFIEAVNILNYTHLLPELHQLIRSCRTGNAGQLAHALRITRSELYMILDELQSMGYPVKYSRFRKTFFYDKNIDQPHKFSSESSEIINKSKRMNNSRAISTKQIQISDYQQAH